MKESTRGFDQPQRSAARPTLESIRKHPGTFVVATIASSLVLILALGVVSLAAATDQLLRQFAATSGIVVVVKAGASAGQVEEIRHALEAVTGSGEIKPVSAEDVLKASSASNADLGGRPLSVLVRARAAPTVASVSRWVDSSRQALATLPMVEAIRVDDSWVRSIDLWAARWIRVKTGVSIGTAVFLGMLIGVIWFLASRTVGGSSMGAGAYIALAGVVLACVLCLMTLWGAWAFVPSLAGVVDPEWRTNILFILGFSIVAALVGGRFATFAR